MDERLEVLEAKIDHLTECLYGLCKYIEERDKNDFSNDVAANIVADVIFEELYKPTFFDGAGRG